jgi:hypothetical protein
MPSGPHSGCVALGRQAMSQVCRSPRPRTSAFCPYSVSDGPSPMVPAPTVAVVAQVPEPGGETRHH